MSAKFFLDTNIFVYSLDQTAAFKRARALELIRDGTSTQMAVVSHQVVQEFFNVALRKMAVPMLPQDAHRYLRRVFLPLLRVTFTPELCAEALKLFSRFSLSWYDSLIVAAAQQAQCEVLYTEDLQHGQAFGSLRVANPFI